MKIFYVKNPSTGEYTPGDHAWEYPASIAKNPGYTGYMPGSHVWGCPASIANQQQTKEQRIPQRNEAKKATVKAGQEQMKKIVADSKLCANFMKHFSR
ncbi:MAG: hypothetical protein II942_04570 [Alphaproteobacteria bacterium]|nr:hypothetical protein [Alphaproteobacteria bacterium]